MKLSGGPLLLAVVLLLLLSSVLSSCAMAPTTVSESDASLIERSYLYEKGHRPIEISKESILLDVRAFFDFQISHLPGASHIDPRDFSLRKMRGDDLQERATKLARRLALLGVNPFSHVVVIGYGEQGSGEEGIVALTLLALGVERVQIGAMQDFRFMATNKKMPARENQRYWEPRVASSLICPGHVQEDATFILDVAPKSAVVLNSPLNNQKLAVVHKDWRSFVSKDDFAPNPTVKSSLRREKIDVESRVMVRGVQAPLVVFSMAQLGYVRVCMMDE